MQPAGLRNPQFHVERSGRTVDVGSGGFVVQRSRRSPQFHVERPGRTVDVGSGGFFVQRGRRSPQFPVERPWQRVDVGFEGLIVERDSRSIKDGRVQGENFVARDDQAGIWDDSVSVWKRPDGRTVSVGNDGSVIVSGHGHTLQVSTLFNLSSFAYEYTYIYFLFAVLINNGKQPFNLQRLGS